MANYVWSTRLAGTYAFNPGADSLIIDEGISAASIQFDTDGTNASFTFGGKTIILSTSPYTLTDTNVTFTDGSKLIIGDDTTGFADDDAANTITGGAGDDQLIGAGGADSISGLGGNDLFGILGADADGIYGDDTIDGGAGGSDFIDYLDNNGFGVTINLGNETASGSATGGDGNPGSGLTLIGIEGVSGTNQADTFNANSATLVNGLRTDIVQFFDGEGGNDTINGAIGDGRITVIQYLSADTGVNVNLANGTASDGWGGTDTFNNIDAVIGSAFNDNIFGGGGFSDSPDEVLQFFEGMAGNDFLGGSRAAYDRSPFGVVVNLSESAISGNYFGAGVITVNAGTARDGWDSQGGGTDTLNGIDVRGSQFADVLVGSDDDDNWLEGLGGNDTIDGRGNIDDDEDTVEYIHATGAVYVNLGLGTAHGIGGDSGVGVDTLLNIEGVRGSDFADSLVGGGTGAFNAFHVEFFEGWAGNDTLNGGDSDPASLDIAIYDHDPSAVVVNLSSSDIIGGSFTVAAGTARDGYGVNGNPAGTDTLVNINAASGSRFDDTLVGGAGDNWFQGGEGNDSIVGGAGSDTAMYDGPDDFSSGVTVNLATGTATDAFGDTDTLAGIENVWGTFLADNITGNGQANRIDGGGGNDVINGGAGTDTALYQFAENRVIVNLDAVNILTQGSITVQPLHALDGNGGTDTLSSIENVVGSDFNDFIRGSNAANLLEGGAGNDLLVGGHQSSDTAADTLLGGDGDDTLRQTRGADSMNGGDGFDDTLVFNNNSGTNTSTGITYGGATGVNVNLGAGTSDYNTADGANPFGTIANIETVFGTAGNDILTGGGLTRSSGGGIVEAYRGGAGNDTIDGQGGGIDGFGFLDRVEFGNINDTPPLNAVIVNLGSTAVTFGGVTVAAGTARDAFGGTDTLVNINWVSGTGHNDTMIGGNSAEEFERFQGNRGNDYIDGRGGIDEVSYQNATGSVNVNLGTGIASGADGIDTLLNIERARGSDFADVLTGSNNTAVVEVFTGDRGNDTINGGAGIDFASWLGVPLDDDGVNAFIASGSGTVTHVTAGTDTLVNIEGLHGTNSNDTLAGGLGDQWFRGRGGSDTLSGGAGIDTADYSIDRRAVTVNLGTGTAADGWGGVWGLQGTDTLISIENVLGSTFNDNITGSTAANLLDGHFGRDTLNGGGGNDTLDGGAGNDSIVGGAGDDVFIDQAGNDVLNGGADDDTFLVNYTSGTVNATGGTGSDTYVLNPDATGSTYRVADFDVTGADAGRDQIDISAILEASALAGFYKGTDPFAGGFLKLVKFGSHTLVQWDLDGAAGSAYNLVTGITLLNVLPSSVTVDNFGGLIIGTAGADSLAGSSESDQIVGGGGNDSLNGGGGDDLLGGGTGRDTMRGGSGNDTYQVDNVNDKVLETSNGAGGLLLPGSDPSGAAGPGLLDVGGITDTVIAAINFSINNIERQHFENIVLTGSASLATGNALANALTGNDGNDTLIGGTGNDTLDGGVGTDSMDGGAGNDIYIVDIGTDKVKELAAQGTDTVHSTATYTLSGNVENLVLTGTAIRNGTGNGGHNRITGNDAKNRITGSGGNDTLDGGAGNDTLVGGAGNDVYVVGSKLDVVTELAGAGEGTDTVQASVSETLDLYVENLVLIGTGNINGTGNTLANTITGNANDNILDGGAGNDTMIGGAGNDTYMVNVTGDKVTETTNKGTDTVQSSANYTLSNHVENLVLTGTLDRNGTGNALDNAITGNGGNNALNGGGGNDTLDGGAGNDTMAGGAGDDTYIVNAAGDVVTEAVGAAGGTDTLQSSVTETLLDANVEHLVLTGNLAINGTGNGLDNTITGNTAANRLDGAAGNDTIAGGTGNDTLIGGAGDDTLVWDPLDGSIQGGTDSAEGDTLRVDGAGVTIDLTAIDNGRITGVEVVNLTGSGNNTLTVALADVLAINATDTLKVLGNVGDTVNAAGFVQGEDSGSFHRYTSGLAVLLVDTGVNVVT